MQKWVGIHRGKSNLKDSNEYSRGQKQFQKEYYPYWME